MSKNMIIGLVVAFLAIAGIGGYIATQGDDDTSPNTTNTSNSTQQASEQANQTSSNNGNSEVPELPQLPTESFVATGTMNDMSANGTSGTFMISVKDSNTYAMEFTAEGQTSEIIVDGQYSYIVADGQTIRFPLDQGQQGLGLDDVSLSSDDYDEFKDNATYLGKMSCSAGQCDVWEATGLGDDDLETGRIYLANDRIVKISATTSDGSNFELEYDYDATPNVSAPDDYIDFSDQFGDLTIPEL